jgi:hypothetical protein
VLTARPANDHEKPRELFHSSVKLAIETARDYPMSFLTRSGDD